MTYYPDLSAYAYMGGRFGPPGAKNIGCLAREHAFDAAPPSAALLDALWRLCKVSIAQTRGVHECAHCPQEDEAYVGTHDGETLLLGTSEIRLVTDGGVVYAAPTLMFHYVKCHQYRPPDEFVAALLRGPIPPAPAYFERLQAHGLEWNATSVPSGRRFRLPRPPTPPG